MKNDLRGAKRRAFTGRITASALLATSLALVLAAPAGAQTAEVEQPVEPEEEPVPVDAPATIVVTGTRIDRAGFEAPTPTTVIGTTELRQAGRDNIGEVLADIPQFRATANPVSNSGSTTAATVGADLRGLGAERTLVLLNGRRFVGVGDLNSVPFGVVERVDIVTGGASAAWGSGAVAGVVNIVIDDNFEGLELGAHTGISSRGDGEQYRLEATAGTNFADGRGNAMISAEYFESEGIIPRTARENYGRYALLANPAYTPTNGESQLIIAPDVGYSIASRGGLILTGSLAGMTFNPDGTLRPFVRGSLVSGALMSGGEGPSFDDTTPLLAPYERLNLFGRTSYELTDSVRLSADVRFSDVTANYGLFPDPTFANLSISTENAFLPEPVRQQLIANGETGFILSRFNTDFGSIQLDVEREYLQGTIGLDGTFGDNWRWDAYYSHGVQHLNAALGNLRITSNFAEALDSVIDPDTGEPICRSALTVPTTACVPINLFGQGSPSEEALRYTLGTTYSFNRGTLDIGAATIRGEPFSLWAGPVSVAFGAEARKESSRTTVDPMSADQRFALINAAPLSGSFSVKEAFGEVLLPLVRDVPLLRSLDLNAAARISDYSTSGSIWSWKVGITNEITDGLQVRAVRSRDIRSPNIEELFTTRRLNLSNVLDPVTGETLQVPLISGGNPNLRPETADTFSAGVVYQPRFMRGLSMSLDYYDINIEGAITTIAAQEIINRCFAGDDALCNQITRNADGDIVEVRATSINLARYETSGVDFELAYRTPLALLSTAAPGTLNLRFLVNYVDKLVSDDGVTRLDSVGDLGTNVTFGIPRWRGLASASYRVSNVTLDLRARYVGGGQYNQLQDIENNEIDSRTYVDLGLQFDVPSASDRPRLSLFGSVANLFDVDPPVLPNPVHFDVIGRYFTVGARARF